MTNVREGSKWVIEADLDPELLKLDQPWRERLKAVGRLAVGIVKIESNHCELFISPYYCVIVPTEAGDEHAQQTGA